MFHNFAKLDNFAIFLEKVVNSETARYSAKQMKIWDHRDDNVQECLNKKFGECFIIFQELPILSFFGQTVKVLISETV